MQGNNADAISGQMVIQEDSSEKANINEQPLSSSQINPYVNRLRTTDKNERKSMGDPAASSSIELPSMSMASAHAS